MVNDAGYPAEACGKEKGWSLSSSLVGTGEFA